MNHKEALAWLIYQAKLNDLAYKADMITDTMHLYAKENLQEGIDKLEKLCYT